MQGKANLVERVITARNDSGTRKSCAESTAQKKARLSIEKLTIHAGKTARRGNMYFQYWCACSQGDFSEHDILLKCARLIFQTPQPEELHMQQQSVPAPFNQSWLASDTHALFAPERKILKCIPKDSFWNPKGEIAAIGRNGPAQIKCQSQEFRCRMTVQTQFKGFLIAKKQLIPFLFLRRRIGMEKPAVAAIPAERAGRLIPLRSCSSLPFPVGHIARSLLCCKICRASRLPPV